MRERARATLGLISLVMVACGRDGDAVKRDVAQQSVSGVCAGADSLIFSDLKGSPGDGGLAGHEIVLHRRLGRWAGSWRGAAGSFGAFEPLEDIKGDSVPGPFSFSSRRERDTTLFRGQISCENLVGELRYFRTVGFIRAAFERKPSLTNLSDDTVHRLAGSLSPPPPQYRDSADVFDPDGYYLMKEDLTIDGQKIRWLELHTVDFYYDHQQHDERPRLVQPPDVIIAISKRADDHGSRYPCAAPLITPDSLLVRCNATPIGDVTLNGHFLDKTGKYRSNPAYDERETLLLIARVVVTRDGRVAHDALHQFLYTVGD
jgi:hypothetical protein